MRKLEECMEKYLETGKKAKDMIVEKKVNMDKEKKMNTIETEGKKCEIKSNSDMDERKYVELKVNGMKTDKEKFKYLVGSFFYR